MPSQGTGVCNSGLHTCLRLFPRCPLFPSLLSSPFLKSASHLLLNQDQMLEHYFVVYYKHKFAGK